MSTKKYWNSLEQLQEDPKFLESAQKEFNEEIPVEEFLGNEVLKDTSTSRRDFLKFMGFSLGAATLAACEAPVVRSIPYVVKPEVVTPGVANWYASSVFRGGNFASVLVKTREGRPIFLKANDKYPEQMRGLNARANASVLELYDDNRYRTAKKGEANISMMDADREIIAALRGVKMKGGNVRVLTGSVMSPSTQAVLNDFAAAYSSEEEGAADQVVVNYDAMSNGGMLDANEKDFGVRSIPAYDFGKAKVIVSLDADFLSSWLDEVSNSIGYVKNRKPENAWMSRHFQFETNLTTTGANADVRGAVRPSELGTVAKALYFAIASKAGQGSGSAKVSDDDNGVNNKIAQAANELWANKGTGLVVSGSNDSNVQQLVNAINTMLGNYGSTLKLDMANNTRSSNDAAAKALVADMKAGKVDALIIYGANPLYTMPASWGVAEAMSKVGLKISLADRPDETSTMCDYVCPDRFFLEAWNDYNPYNGMYTIAQPVIKPLFPKTRAAQESLLTWAGKDADFYNYMRQVWERDMFPASGELLFDGFWNRVVQEGIYQAKPAAEATPAVYAGNAAAAASAIKAGGSGLEVNFYFKGSMGDGSQANNPHLQELPDTMSKVSWDNYITMNPADMEGKFETNTAQQTPADMAKLTVNGQSINLPVVAAPGQKVGTVGVALGYGRTVTGPAGKVGQNAYPLMGDKNGTLSYYAEGSIEELGETYPIASVQTHDTMMGRKIVNETDITTFKSVDKNDPVKGWNKDLELVDGVGKKRPLRELNLWDDHGLEIGHHWAMSIDLNACTGCGSCVTACHIDNNVPVVGKDEIRRTRSMFWLRIDRYYSSDTTKANASEEGKGMIDTYAEMEVPSKYPEVVFQPMMCQHCNHAPCETVCPVAATTHSEEGLNQMAYNRCVGTRYCANNCPYKVRRFNWFNYNKDPKFTDVNPAQNELARMVLNPDVVVRSRGVIEKCSFCVQHIQAGKLAAKKAGRPIEDGEVTSTCAAACPTNAITFGDINDKDAKVRADWKLDRAYAVIEEVGTQPNVKYLTKVRNTKANA
ncbi:TAT-variant-translocated molybdopterin oxidoreductase [bacterium SCSIO 12741]|nr:TAT-variant-translocated molybdopterin oxidoreductase [bacterium SCSIO 12741]